MRSIEEIDADMARHAQVRYDAEQKRIKDAAREAADADAAKSAEIARLSAALSEALAQLEAERARNAAGVKMRAEFSRIIHDQVVAQQSAWIEWQHGGGAEAAMVWVHNGLAGPGHIPEDSLPYGKEAQAWFDANQAEPFPTCFCGRPSNQLWMGQGFCSVEHYAKRRAEQPPAPPLAIIPGGTP